MTHARSLVLYLSVAHARTTGLATTLVSRRPAQTLVDPEHTGLLQVDQHCIRTFHARCANAQDGELLQPDDLHFLRADRDHRTATADEISLFDAGMRDDYTLPGERGTRCRYGHVDVGALAHRDMTSCAAHPWLKGVPCGSFEFLCTCAPPELAQGSQAALVHSWSTLAVLVFGGTGLLGFLIVGAGSFVLAFDETFGGRAAGPRPGGQRRRPAAAPEAAPGCAWILRLGGLTSLVLVSLAAFAITVALQDPAARWGAWPYTYYDGCDDSAAASLVRGAQMSVSAFGMVAIYGALTWPPAIIIFLGIGLQRVFHERRIGGVML